MSRQEELRWSANIQAAFRRAGGVAVQTHQLSTPGMADIVFALRGCPGWAELKVARPRSDRAPAFTFTERQLQFLLDWREQGWRVCLVVLVKERQRWLVVGDVGLAELQWAAAPWGRIKEVAECEGRTDREGMAQLVEAMRGYVY